MMDNIIFAFVGGGVVTLTYEVAKTLINNYRIRQLFLLEILFNIKAVSNVPAEYEWVRGNTFNSFYKTNSASLVVFKAEVASVIISFYGLIDLFHPDENEIQNIRWLDGKGYPDESKKRKDVLSAENKAKRERIRAAGVMILKAKPCNVTSYLEQEIAKL